MKQIKYANGKFQVINGAKRSRGRPKTGAGTWGCLKFTREQVAALPRVMTLGAMARGMGISQSSAMQWVHHTCTKSARPQPLQAARMENDKRNRLQIKRKDLLVWLERTGRIQN